MPSLFLTPFPGDTSNCPLYFFPLIPSTIYISNHLSVYLSFCVPTCWVLNPTPSCLLSRLTNPMYSSVFVTGRMQTSNNFNVVFVDKSSKNVRTDKSIYRGRFALNISTFFNVYPCFPHRVHTHTHTHTHAYTHAHS